MQERAVHTPIACLFESFRPTIDADNADKFYIVEGEGGGQITDLVVLQTRHLLSPQRLHLYGEPDSRRQLPGPIHREDPVLLGGEEPNQFDPDLGPFGCLLNWQPGAWSIPKGEYGSGRALWVGVCESTTLREIVEPVCSSWSNPLGAAGQALGRGGDPPRGSRGGVRRPIVRPRPGPHLHRRRAVALRRDACAVVIHGADGRREASALLPFDTRGRRSNRSSPGASSARSGRTEHPVGAADHSARLVRTSGASLRRRSRAASREVLSTPCSAGSTGSTWWSHPQAFHKVICIATPGAPLSPSVHQDYL